MYRTYSYNDMPKPVMRHREEERPKPQKDEACNKKCDEHKSGGILDGLLGNMEADDIILLIVVLALIIDDCDDKLLLLALGFVFISEWL